MWSVLVRFRHLNGNLKLAGSGNGIDLWGVSWWPTTLAVSGRWGRFTETCHGAPDWIGAIESICGGVPDWFMGTCDTGWIGAMELFHGDMRHWLERGNGVDLWRCVALAGTGWWDWFRGACHGGTRHWLDHATWADLWGYVMGVHDWIGEMELICGGTPWGATLAGCGWWYWFMGAFHGGAQLDRGDGNDLWRRHLLDLGEGIDLCGRIMRARNTGWIGAMGLIHGGVSNDKVTYGCWI